MRYVSPRLPHVITRADLALLLAPTYAEAARVDGEEAHERLLRALEDPGLVDDLLHGISVALEPLAREATDVDALLDRLSKGVAKRAGRTKAAAATPGIAALMVRIDLGLGLAPEGLRATLDSEKGRALLEQGIRTLGAHLVKALVR